MSGVGGDVGAEARLQCVEDAAGREEEELMATDLDFNRLT